MGGGVLWTLLIAFLAGLPARALEPGNNKPGLSMTILQGILVALRVRFIGGALGGYAPASQPVSTPRSSAPSCCSSSTPW